jgi:protein-tyrosine-phosphatase
MSTAFAQREAAERGLDDHITITTGGTDPAEHVHPEVIEVMDECGIDLSDRTPKQVSTETLEACDLVVTMGCSTLSLSADVDIRDWALPDPDGEDLDAVRDTRDEIEDRISGVFDEIEAELGIA